ncbi:O-antigen/teichoic acid export membrane protein [Paenibacillus sp. V4I3]|nr:O-antigen/teichoic acid export membrane protein [Paenibacillus sp. V4I3]
MFRVSNPLALKVNRVVPLMKGLMKGKDTVSTSIRALLASMFILGLNMLTGIMTSRFLGPSGRGDHATMILWPQFLAFVMTIGMHSAVVYNMKKYPEDAGKLYISSLLLSCASGIVACAIGVYFIPIWLSTYSSQVIQFAQGAMIITPVILLTFVNNAVLRARNEFALFNFVRYLMPIATLIMLLCFLAAGRLTPFTSAIAYLGPNVPIVIWLTIRLLRIYRVQWRGSWVSMKRNIKYGLGSYGIDLLGNMSLYVDQLIVIRLLSSADLGLYVVAVSLSRMANIFSQSLSLILFPKSSGLPKDEVIAMTVRAFRVSTFISILAAIAAMLVAPYVLIILYGSDFKSAVSVFRLLILEVVITGSSMVISQAYMALGRPGIVTMMYAVGLGVMVPLLFWFVPVFGITGAGMAMLLAAIIRLGFILVNFPLTLKVPFPHIFKFTEDMGWVKQIMLSKLKGYKNATD